MNTKKHNKLSGIRIITKMLKKYNYELIIKIGKKKNLSDSEIEDLIEDFWKVTYYTPITVKTKFKETAQGYFI